MSENTQLINCIDCKYKSTCFKKLFEKELEFINKNKIQIKYKKGETIYKQGAFSENIMFIVDGFAKKYIEGTNNFTLKISKYGDYIGLSSLFCSEEHCHYSVSAVTDTTLCLIKKSNFKKLIKNNSDFAQEILKWYCNNDKFMFNKFKSINNKNMHGRIAEIVLYLNRTEFADLKKLITRKFLAEFAGISIESTIRILSEFKKDKIIDIKRKSIEVLNKDLLRQISEKG